RRAQVVRGLARAQCRALRKDRPLRDRAVRDRWILLLRELDLHLRLLGELLLQLRELRLGVAAQSGGDLDVLSLHLKPHLRLLVSFGNASVPAYRTGRARPSRECCAPPLRRCEVRARRAHRHLPALWLVVHLDDALVHLHERAVAAVLGEPLRASYRRRCVPAAGAEAALPLTPDLANDRRGHPLGAALLALGTHAEVALHEAKLDDRLLVVGAAE